MRLTGIMLVQPSSDPVTQVEPESQTVEVAAARRGGMAECSKSNEEREHFENRSCVQ